ncbi:MAG: putative 60 kDa inner membrane insertion protein [Parcubacteria group bacterium Gr01-1014_38]|nr:MAG: putative 60 kDa inner membrane insertion protein [Parcubacteria group bacterium Gr01-1014_38]
MSIFHEFLYRPLFNALIALYAFLPGGDLGVAIIVLTVAVRLLLSPLLLRQFRSQRALADLQPKVTEIRQSTKDPSEQSRKLLELYRRHGVSPVGGCLPLLVQLPILWAMYAALQGGLNPDAMSALYPFIPKPEMLDATAFGVVNLAQPAFQRPGGQFIVSWPAVILAALTVLVTYWQMRLTPTPQSHSPAEDRTPAEQLTHRMSGQFRFIVPLTTGYFTLILPAGIALYWFTTTLVAVAQQWYLLRKVQPVSSLHGR